MTNPFTSFAFSASGTNQAKRTLPDRLADVHNVKDFGATGDGVTDDWAAITAAFNWTAAAARGTIYFPPGTYLVSQPIILFANVADNLTGIVLGEMGLSTITGNFADYIFSQSDAANTNLNVVEKLTIINTHATGGGIRLGGTVGGAIRDCTIIANKGINTNTDSTPADLGSLEISIENCVLSPGAHVTNSQGIITVSDGPILNCTITGYAIGLQMAGGEGACVVSGCHFEQCGTAIRPGLNEDGTSSSASGTIVTGCSFKNNSIAINFQASSGISRFSGIFIEGTNGQAPGGLNPQYGILDGNGGSSDFVGTSMFSGVKITGQYDVAGVYIFGSPSVKNTSYRCVSSVSWTLDRLGGVFPNMPTFIACNQNYIYPVSDLPASGTEGVCYNVSDGTNRLAWGATVTNTSTHTTHYKVRYNGTNWTVMGA